MKYWIPQFLFCSQIQRDFSVLLWTFLVMKYWTPQLWISGLNKSLYRKKLLMLLFAGRRRFKIRHQILFKLQMLTNFNPTDIKQIKIIFRQGIERSRGDRGEMVLVQTTKMSNFEILCTIYVLCFLSSSRNISWSHVYQTRSQRQLYFIPKMKFWTNHIKLTRINWIAQAGKLLNFYCKKLNVIQNLLYHQCFVFVLWLSCPKKYYKQQQNYLIPIFTAYMYDFYVLYILSQSKYCFNLNMSD